VTGQRAVVRAPDVLRNRDPEFIRRTLPYDDVADLMQAALTDLAEHRRLPLLG